MLYIIGGKTFLVKPNICDSRSAIASPAFSLHYTSSHDEQTLSQLVFSCKALAIKTKECKYLVHAVISLSLQHIFYQHVFLWNSTGRTPFPLQCHISYLLLYFILVIFVIDEGQYVLSEKTEWDHSRNELCMCAMRESFCPLAQNG